MRNLFDKTVPRLRVAALATAVAIGTTITSASDEPLCIYVSSYHQGYSWSDRVEQGLRDGLGERCELVQFNMDTKRRKSAEQKLAAAAAAMALIEQSNPDIVITSDDNAARYLIAPYLLDSETPVVFSGVNWTVEEYGFPAENVTGIVEVAPIEPLIAQALASVPTAVNAAYIGAMTLTEHKNYHRVEQTAKEAGVELFAIHVETFKDWKVAFDLAQEYDFVIIGSHAGIEDWEFGPAALHATLGTRKLSLTNDDWMMPVTGIGFTKVPEEHGEWAAASAVAILSGTRPSSIPMVTNRKSDTWINQELIEAAGISVPEALVRRAKRYP